MALLPKDPAQQKLVLLGLLPLLGAFAFWYFVHAGTVEEIERLEVRLEQLTMSNERARVLAERGGPELENRLAIYEQHMQRLEQLIPSREEVPALLNSVVSRADAAGIELGGYRPGGEEARPHYSRQSYELSVIGTYHEIGSFLAAVGSLPRIINTSNVMLRPEPRTRTDGSQVLRATFRIETYILPTPGEAQANQAGD
jgi:type IV pilus assembly protein PilO